IECVRGLFDIEYADALIRHDEMRIHRIAYLARAPVLFQIDMGCLRQSMNARIGAPGSAQCQLFTAKFLESLLDRPLHTMAVGLPLPARIRCAILLDPELIVRPRP